MKLISLDEPIPPSIRRIIILIVIILAIIFLVKIFFQEPPAKIETPKIYSRDSYLVDKVKALKSPESIVITLGDSNYQINEKKLVEANTDENRRVIERDYIRTLPKSEIIETTHKLCIEMFGEEHWLPLYNLIMSESGFDNESQNPNSTAYGIFQFLDTSWKSTGIEKTSDPLDQIEAGFIYIHDRYISPTEAWEFKIKNNWY